jgi:predicted Zn-dependent protease
MTQQQKTRRQTLEEFTQAHPGDAFGRYGLALECAKDGDHDAAIEHFRQLLADHPDYVAGYFHYGQLLVKLARTEEAKQILSAGIAVAQKVGNQHAGMEMQAALTELG